MIEIQRLISGSYHGWEFFDTANTLEEAIKYAESLSEDSTNERFRVVETRVCWGDT